MSHGTITKNELYLNPGGAVTLKLAVSELQAEVGSETIWIAPDYG
jgi:hypothetical protein